MGGKPGQSRGCGTCRRRKKGCDLMRPTCGQCLKSNLTCTGYDKEPKWEPDQKSSQKAQELLLFTDGSNDSNGTRQKSPPHMILMPKLPSSCEKAAARDGWYGGFMQHWEPQTASGRRVEAFMRGNWILDMPKLATEDSLIACAFDALSLIRLGNLSKDRSIVERSEVEYGKALRVVRSRLLEPDQSVKVQQSTRKQSPLGRGQQQPQLKLLLSAILMLGQYEILSASREKAVGWMSHTQAALALHQQCVEEGGEYSDLLRKFRAALRTDSIIRAISNRDPKWLIPQPELPTDPDDKLDLLFRMMEEIPAILQQTETLLQVPITQLPAVATDLANNTARVYAKFDAWRQLQETSVIDSGYWYEERRPLYHIDSADPITRQCIWFSDLETATAYSILWSGILKLCITHCTTTRWLTSALAPSTLASLTYDNNPEPLAPHIFTYTNLGPTFKEAALCVKNINSSLEYFLQPEVGSLTSRIVSFPLAIAMGWELRSPAGKVSPQTTEALQILRERDGIPLDTFLAGIHAAAETKPKGARDLRGSKSRLAV